MLRANLATRPFYNERAIHFLLGIAAVIVLAITVLNVSRIVTTINKDELALVVNAAQEANALIDQRTFSWTEFFNQIEATIPRDVMLTSVRPSFKDGITRVTMMVLGRRTEDLEEFIEKLEATGFFEDINRASTEMTEDGLRRATIESVYVGNVGATEETPADVAPAAPSTPSKAPSPADHAPGRAGQPPAGAAPASQSPRDRGRQ